MKKIVAVSLFTAVSILSVSCNRNPEVAKRKFIENGNKYFDKQKYKEALILYRKALQKDAKFGEGYFRAGLTYLKLQRYGEANRNLQRAVELQPTNKAAFSALSDLYLAAYAADPVRSKNLLPELQSLATKAAANFPESFERERLDGYLALFRSDMKEALAHFEKAYHYDTNRPDLVLVYMQALANDGRPEEAEKIAYELLKADPHALVIYDALAKMYGAQKRTDDIQRIYKSKLENNPKVAAPYLQLAGYYRATQRRPEMLETLKRLSDDTADFPKGALLVGDFFLEARDNAAAYESYKQGLDKADKDKPMYQKRMVEALVRQNKRDEAVNLASQLVKDNPNDGDALAIRGGLALMSGKKEDVQSAIADLQAASTKSPNNAAIKFTLSKAYLAKGDQALAKAQLEEAVKAQSSYLPARALLAEILLKEGDAAKALRTTQEILNQSPGDIAGHLLHSRSLIAIGDLKQARAELTQLLKDKPTLGDAMLQLASVDLAEKNYKVAEDVFRKLYAATKDSRSFIGLVQTLAAEKQTDAAVKLLRDELNQHPDRIDYRTTLGNVLFSANDPKAASVEYKKVLETTPQAFPVWQRLAECYRQTNDYDSAFAALKKAQEAAPSNPGASLQMALMYEALGQKPSARPLYEQVLRLQPDNPVALNNLAFMLADSGQDLDQALTMAQKAKQQMPKDTNVSDTLGWIFIKKNLPDSAINIYKDLVAQEPNRATFRYHLAMALTQKGDKASAKRELDLALRSKPAKAEEDRIREAISKLG